MHVGMGCGQAIASYIHIVVGKKLLVYEYKCSRYIQGCEIASAFILSNISFIR